MIRKIFTRISEAILRYRYRRLYHRLFWYYAKKCSSADKTGIEACDAFIWLTGEEWKDWAFNDVPKCQ